MRFRPQRGLVVSALAALVLVSVPATASPAGRLVIHGAHSGTTLTLTTKAGRLVVKGRMAHVKPHGCRFTQGRDAAVCRLAGVGAIELDMGPGGDFVRVAERLPVPLTAYLGSGSDKFVGNGERDSCFPQGSRRNRCVGGGGNDVCITGPRNSDCVGGPGNDYCKTRTGSDGCWGGPGNDVCYMGPGQDGCHGEGGDDRLYGGAQPDQLYGGPGFDFCDGGPGWGKSHTCDAGPRR
jgi:hypothetical protein